MKKLYILTSIAVLSSLVGVVFIVEKRSFTTVLIGFALIAFAGPYLYYAYSKIRNGYRGSREQDALERAQQELDIQRRLDGKK